MASPSDPIMRTIIRAVSVILICSWFTALPTQAAGNLSDAKYALRMGECDEAISLLEALIAKSSDAEANYQHGKALLGACAEAKHTLEPLNTLESAAILDHPRAQFLLAQQLIERGNHDAGRHWLEKAAASGLKLAQKQLDQLARSTEAQNDVDLCNTTASSDSVSLTQGLTQRAQFDDRESICIFSEITASDLVLLDDKEINLNATNSKHQSPLHLATIRGDIAIVQWLLKRGANPDLQDSQGNTALHHAVRLSLEDIVSALLAAGAGVNLLNEAEQAPLDLARVDEPATAKLKAAGARSGTRNSPTTKSAVIILAGDTLIEDPKSPYDGWPAVNYYAWTGNDKAIDHVLASNSPLVFVDPGNLNAFQRALCSNRLSIARKLFDSPNHWEWSPESTGAVFNCPLDPDTFAYALSYAPAPILASADWTSIIERQQYLSNAQIRDQILSNTAITGAWSPSANDLKESLIQDDGALFSTLVELNPQAAALNANSLLALAVEHCREDATSRVIQLGADTSMKDTSNGDSLLHKALKADCSVEMTMQLEATSKDIDAQNLAGNTALHIAARAGNNQVTANMLARGADVELRNHESFTPLMLAAKQNHPEIIEMLVTAGAKVHRKDRDGNSALNLANQSGAAEAAAKLESLDRGLLGF